MPFGTDTAVRSTGDGSFEAEITDQRWWWARGPNGGFVAAIVVNALKAALDDPAREIRSLTIQYPGTPDVGKLAIAVTTERVGRTTAYLSARGAQDGKAFALALATFASEFPGEPFQTATMPDVPPPEEIEPRPLPPGAPVFTENFEYRFALGGAAFEGHEEASTGGWLRLREGAQLDAALAAVYVDSWAPALFWRLSTFAIVPTIDLTIHFREIPSGYDDFVFATFESRREHDGLWEENGELWSRDGRLLVQSRQLAAHISLAGAGSGFPG